MLDFLSIFTSGGFVLYQERFNIHLTELELISIVNDCICDQFILQQSTKNPWIKASTTFNWYRLPSKPYWILSGHPTAIDVPYIISFLNQVYHSIVLPELSSLTLSTTKSSSRMEDAVWMKHKFFTDASWHLNWKHQIHQLLNTFESRSIPSSIHLSSMKNQTDGEGKATLNGVKKKSKKKNVLMVNEERKQIQFINNSLEHEPLKETNTIPDSSEKMPLLSSVPVQETNQPNIPNKLRKKNKESTNSSKKALRKWDDTPLSKQEVSQLDYSQPSPSTTTTTTTTTATPSPSLPTTNANSSSLDTPSTSSTSSFSLSSLLSLTKKGNTYQPTAYTLPSSVSSSSSSSDSDTSYNKFSQFLVKTFSTTRTLTSSDLAPLLATLQSQLLSKNVASEITRDVLMAIEQSLVGHQVGWRSLRTQVYQTLASLTHQWLADSSTTSQTWLNAIQQASRSSSSSPYTILICGVNGVGKSTNLAKLAFWLLANQISVLVAACDTFRSGAMEQLQTHVTKLSHLGKIDLYQRDYGRDAAHLAKEAIKFAQQHQYQVVLIDTAGRMQDNEPLMRALAKLVALNQPHRILFVGEATVGNTSLDQLSKFNQALKNFAPTGSVPREIDAFILTKFDIIGDQVGSVLNLTYKTRKPILFIGTGQTYTDLKLLDVDFIVKCLLS